MLMALLALLVLLVSLMPLALLALRARCGQARQLASEQPVQTRTRPSTEAPRPPMVRASSPLRGGSQTQQIDFGRVRARTPAAGAKACNPPVA